MSCHAHVRARRAPVQPACQAIQQRLKAAARRGSNGTAKRQLRSRHITRARAAQAAGAKQHRQRVRSSDCRQQAMARVKHLSSPTVGAGAGWDKCAACTAAASAHIKAKPAATRSSMTCRAASHAPLSAAPGAPSSRLLACCHVFCLHATPAVTAGWWAISSSSARPRPASAAAARAVAAPRSLGAPGCCAWGSSASTALLKACE
jgi:hypothetical protein